MKTNIKYAKYAKGLMCHDVSTWVISDPTCLCVTIKTNQKGSRETKWLRTSVFSTKVALNPERNLPGPIRVAMVVMELGQLNNCIQSDHLLAVLTYLTLGSDE